MTDRSKKLQAAIDAQTTDDGKSLAYTRFVLAELLEENLKLKEMLVEQNSVSIERKTKLAHLRMAEQYNQDLQGDE